MQQAAQPPNYDLEQLKQVYDYAKFHIGLYAGVIGAFGAFLGLAGEEVKRRYKWYFIAVFILLLAAGVCGGVVASNIVYTRWDQAAVANLVKEFSQPTVGRLFRWDFYKWFAIGEHYFFWFAILVSIYGFVRVSWADKVDSDRTLRKALRKYMAAAPLGGEDSFRTVGVEREWMRLLEPEKTTARYLDKTSGYVTVEGAVSYLQETGGPDAAVPAEVLKLATRKDGKYVALLRREDDDWSVSSCVVVATE